MQAVGRLGRKRGKEVLDIDTRLLKPARFAVDPVYAIPSTMSAGTVQEDRMDPGKECLTYAYRNTHPRLYCDGCLQNYRVDWR